MLAVVLIVPKSALPRLTFGRPYTQGLRRGQFGDPALKGSVTFEYCSYKGGPSNDINRPDEAPMEACAAGRPRGAVCVL